MKKEEEEEEEGVEVKGGVSRVNRVCLVYFLNYGVMDKSQVWLVILGKTVMREVIGVCLGQKGTMSFRRAVHAGGNYFRG